MSDPDPDELHDTEDDLDTSDGDEDFLPALAAPAQYDVSQILDQHRRAMRRVMRRQRMLIKQVNDLRQIERDRKLYGKIVIGAGSVLMAFFTAAGAYFAGFWGRHN